MTFVSLKSYSTYTWDNILGDPDTNRMKLVNTDGIDILNVDPKDSFWIVGVIEVALILLVIIVITVKAHEEHAQKRSEYVTV